jgi:hypothetical protein
MLARGGSNERQISQTKNAGKCPDGMDGMDSMDGMAVTETAKRGYAHKKSCLFRID